MNGWNLQLELINKSTECGLYFKHIFSFGAWQSFDMQAHIDRWLIDWQQLTEYQIGLYFMSQRFFKGSKCFQKLSNEY